MDTQVTGNRKIVHGHTPRALHYLEADVKNEKCMVFNIDCGCVYSGDHFKRPSGGTESRHPGGVQSGEPGRAGAGTLRSSVAVRVEAVSGEWSVVSLKCQKTSVSFVYSLWLCVQILRSLWNKISPQLLLRPRAACLPPPFSISRRLRVKPGETLHFKSVSFNEVLRALCASFAPLRCVK